MLCRIHFSNDFFSHIFAILAFFFNKCYYVEWKLSVWWNSKQTADNLWSQSSKVTSWNIQIIHCLLQVLLHLLPRWLSTFVLFCQLILAFYRLHRNYFFEIYLVSMLRFISGTIHYESTATEEKFIHHHLYVLHCSKLC